jgi:HNH endonuclease
MRDFMRQYRLVNIPTTDEYVAGITALSDRISNLQRRLLTAQYSAVNRTVTAGQLAILANISGGYPVVNSQYGRLGHMLCDQIGLTPELRPDDTHRWWSVWSSGYSHPDGFQWVMHPQVATALEILSWVNPLLTITDMPIATDIETPTNRIPYSTLRILRDTTLACFIKRLHNYKCQICGTTIPLSNGKFYAEAHHIQPLGSPHNGPDVESNIIILCPNHHAMCDYAAITLDLKMLTMHPEHEISAQYIKYHNHVVASMATDSAITFLNS